MDSSVVAAAAASVVQETIDHAEDEFKAPSASPNAGPSKVRPSEVVVVLEGKNLGSASSQLAISGPQDGSKAAATASLAVAAASASRQTAANTNTAGGNAGYLP